MVIWRDADEAGMRARDKIIEKLSGLGVTEITVLDVSDKPAKWDAADAEAGGWGEAEVRKFVRTSSAPAVRPVTEEAEKPVIKVVAGELSAIATLAEQAVVDAGVQIYCRDSNLVRPVVEEIHLAKGRRASAAQLAPVDPIYLHDILCRVILWGKFYVGTGFVRIDPPKDVAATILARFGEWLFPPVVGITTTPTLREDGTILEEPGYDSETRLFLSAPPTMPPIAAEPTREDAELALALLRGLLGEFPFTSDLSESVALSMLITPVVRGAFSVTPMHVANAPAAASGKSFLIDLAAVIASGQPCPVIAAGRDEEETEKRLGAALLTGQALINIDNVNGGLGGDALCQAVERPVMQIRVLGKSKLVRITARGTTLFATGNNIVMSGDMNRRAIVCTLDSALERPELRQFAGDPIAQVLADRGKYVAACLTLVRAYIVAGRPNLADRLASFEDLSDNVRSALMWLGCDDPVLTMETARADDPDLDRLANVLAAWGDDIGTGTDCRRTVAQVLAAIEERDQVPSGNDDGSDRPYRYQALRDAIFAVGYRGRVDARSIGNFLRRNKMRIVAGLRFDNRADKS